MRLNLKPGIRDGQRLKLKGKGGVGADGTAGDLYLTLHITPDARFRREVDDLHTEVAVDLMTALLGGEVLVETLSGTVKVPVTEGTQPDAILRLRGKGMPSYSQPGQYGALYVKLKIQLPKNLSGPEKDLLRQALGRKAAA